MKLRSNIAVWSLLALVANGTTSLWSQQVYYGPQPGRMRSTVVRATAEEPANPPSPPLQRNSNPNVPNPVRGGAGVLNTPPSADGSRLPAVTSNPESVAPIEIPFGLTLADLESMALSMNPSISQLAARVEATRGTWLQVGLYPNPFIGYSGQQIGSRGVADQTGVYFGGDIVLGRKLRINRQVAERDIVRAEQDLSAQELRVLTDVRIGFYDVLIAQRRLDLNQELLQIGTQALNAAEALMKAKEVSRVDVLQAKVETDQARILYQNTQNRYSSSWRTLAAVIGNESLNPRPLSGNLDDANFNFEWTATLQRLLGSSPEINLAMVEIEKARWTLTRARVEPIPNINVQAIVQKDAQIHNTDGALQATMPFPLFNRNQGNIRAAESSIIVAENAYRRVELDLQNRLALVFERYANARNQVDKYRKDILPSAKESLALTREGYRAGEFGFLVLLTAQRTYSQTNLAYLDALRELWAASMEIEGLLLKDSLGTSGAGGGP